MNNHYHRHQQVIQRPKMRLRGLGSSINKPHNLAAFQPVDKGEVDSVPELSDTRCFTIPSIWSHSPTQTTKPLIVSLFLRSNCQRHKMVDSIPPQNLSSEMYVFSLYLTFPAFSEEISERFLFDWLCSKFRTAPRCRGCLKVFADRQKLVEHQKSPKNRNSKCAFTEHHVDDDKSGGVLYECNAPKCDAIFFGIGALHKHKERVHHKPFRCRFRKICNKRFGTPQSAAIHERLHRGQRPEICKVCKMAFVDPGTLRQHLINMHGDGQPVKPYICRICHRRFIKPSLLKRHFESHSDLKRTVFECKECGKEFKMFPNLNRHLRIKHRDSGWR